MFSGFHARIKLGALLTDPFDVDTGVVQGSRLGPTLFNIFFDHFVSEIQKLPGAQFSFGEKCNVSAFADDLVLIANTPTQMKKLLSFVEKYSAEHDFEFHPEKCKIMRVHPSPKKIDFKLNGSVLECVKQYKYLGVELSQSVEVGNRPACFGKYFSRLFSKVTSRGDCIRLLGANKDGLRPTSAIKLYKLLVRPLFEYAAQCIIFEPTQVEKFEKLQTKIIKKKCLGLTP